MPLSVTRELRRWLLSASGQASARRRYRGDTLILETRYQAPGGAVVVLDFMPPAEGDMRADVMRMGIFRRHSRMWLWSTAPTTSPRP